MLHDILLISYRHKKAAKRIMKYLTTHTMNSKCVVAIGGESGSGKSEVAYIVAKKLNEDGILTDILHTDNFYKVHPKERGEYRKQRNFECVGFDEIDWDKIKQCVNEFYNDKESTQPCINLVTQEVDTITTNYKGRRALIVDGLYALKLRKDLGDKVSFTAMIDLTYHSTKKAQLSRMKENLDNDRLKVLEAEHQAVQSLRKEADYMITLKFDVVVNEDDAKQ